MEVMYRAYKRSSKYRGCSSLELTQSTSTWSQSHIRLHGLSYRLLVVSVLWYNTDRAFALGAFQASVNVNMHTRQIQWFHDDMNVNVGDKVSEVNNWQQFDGIGSFVWDFLIGSLLEFLNPIACFVAKFFNGSLYQATTTWNHSVHFRNNLTGANCKLVNSIYY